MNTPAIRIILFIIVYLAVTVLPWYFTVLILAGFTIYFPLYIEVLFFGFLYDMLYAQKYTFPYEGLILATVFLIVTLFVKANIRK